MRQGNETRTGARRPAVLEHLPWRVAGLVLLGALVVIYQPDQGGLVHRVAVPVAMAFATWLLVQNVAAVALGAGVLAGVHSAPGSGDWVRSFAYPGLAGICGVIVGAVLLARFRRRISATHEARWRRRRKRQGQNQQEDGGS